MRRAISSSRFTTAIGPQRCASPACRWRSRCNGLGSSGREQIMRRRDFLFNASAATVALPAFVGRAIAQAKTVTLWHIYNNESDMIHLGIRKFNESRKDYQIEQRLVPYTQINPELVRAIATGLPPDLVVINDPDLASYASQGQFTDLTDLVAASKVIDAGKYFKGPQTSDHWKGRRYSIAREVNTL